MRVAPESSSGVWTEPENMVSVLRMSQYSPGAQGAGAAVRGGSRRERPPGAAERMCEGGAQRDDTHITSKAPPGGARHDPPSVNPRP